MKPTQTPSENPNHQTIKTVTEYLPLAAFFITYYVADLMRATIALLVGTVISIIVSYIILRKIPMVALITACFVGIFGGLTLWFNDPIFLKLKPTIVQILMGAGLFISVLMGRPAVKFVMGNSLKLTPEGWQQLTLRFAGFMWFGALCNEIVWRNFSTEVWVNFKVFGLVGLTMGFMVLQLGLIKRHMIS